jgi:hypothetical protein
VHSLVISRAASLGYGEECSAQGLTFSRAEQVSKTSLSQKKSHVMEIQVNGGSLKDKIDFGYKLFEQQVLSPLRRWGRNVPAATRSAERGVWRLGQRTGALEALGIRLGGSRGALLPWGPTAAPALSRARCDQSVALDRSRSSPSSRPTR